MQNNLVIVESPAKSKTIEEFLGKDYKVIASYGHIRQLSSTPDAVNFENNQVKFNWEKDKKKIDNIVKNLKGIKKIYLATDMDREGEAIAWHIFQIIKENGFKGEISRIFFFEITKSAILKAIENERSLDDNLVNSYFARVGLDHHVGFSVSPILWKKFPIFKNQSAGRVQSPALRLIAEKEFARNNFEKNFYYSIEGDFLWNKIEFEGKLITFENKKIEDGFEDRKFLEKAIETMDKKFIIESTESKIIKSKPDAPLMTSTLQQEGHKSFGLKVADIMKVAQELYEGVKINGKNTALITYMRTDSVNISKEALGPIRKFIESHYKSYLPAKANIYKNKVKNAQEAHECIRPTYIDLTPEKIKDSLTDNQFKIYSLIWKRVLASQMISATKQQENVMISSKNATFKTTTTIIKEPGYLEILGYKQNSEIIPMKKGDSVTAEKIEIKDHETQMPARFTEASLVKELEKYGIGRPSTYASILEVLQKRNYVIKAQKALKSTFKGELVSCFLREYFSKYVDYQFTANIEDVLDLIANGKEKFEKILLEFSSELLKNIEEIKNVNNIEVFKKISPVITKELHKSCECGGNLEMRMKFSFFFICEKCNTIYKTEEDEEVITGDIKIIKTDKFQYIMRDNTRIYLPQKFNETLNEEDINLIASLPKEVGKYEDSSILAGMSKYGFYLKFKDKYYAAYWAQLKKMTEELAISIITKPTFKKKIVSENKKD